MKELPEIYEFDPQIYPRKLWVCIGVDDDYINENFRYNMSRNLLSFDSDFPVDAVTFTEVVRNDTNMVGQLVVFSSKNEITFGNIIHESSHVCDAIEKAIGMEHGGEPSAYLLSWIGEKINDVRLGDCKPIEFK